MAVFTVMGLLLAGVVGFITHSVSYAQVASNYTEAVLDSAKLAAFIVGKCIEDIIASGHTSHYDDTYDLLMELKYLHELTYLYALIPDVDNRGGTYLFDILSDENDPDLMFNYGDYEADVIDYDILLEIFLTGTSENSTLISESEYGYLATGYAPVFAADGSIIAVAGADLPMGVVLRDVRRNTFQIAGSIIAIVTVFQVFLGFIIEKQLLNPIVKLSHHMSGFDSEEGKLTEFDFPASGDELQAMAESFNRMVGDIRLYVRNLATVTAQNERIATELNVATQIQASMLPCILPPFSNREEFQIYASMLPAKEVGGDFYDFFLVDDRTLAIVVADVSGKGIPAALFMVITKTLIKNNAQTALRPGEVFSVVNDMLCENNYASMFVTAFLGYYDLESGVFTFVNAGHNPPLLKRKDGAFEFIKTNPSFVLAGFEGIPYKEEEIILQPGDTLFLYTDGVTEATNTADELFSDPRLVEATNCYKDYSLHELLEAVKKEIDLFADGAEQADDITMLALSVTHLKESSE